jgi:hypothetical protein
MIVILAKMAADGDGWVLRRGDCSDVLEFCVLHVWCVSAEFITKTNSWQAIVSTTSGTKKIPIELDSAITHF